jgi:hypothetical protein
VWGGQGPYKDCIATEDDDEVVIIISLNIARGLKVKGCINFERFDEESIFAERAFSEL